MTRQCSTRRQALSRIFNMILSSYFIFCKFGCFVCKTDTNTTSLLTYICNIKIHNMNKFAIITFLMLFAITTMAQTQQNTTDMNTNTIKLTIEGRKTFTATLVDNSSTQALLKLLDKEDITVEMEDYANMEKVGSLGTHLPRNDRQTTTGPGDLILYQGHYFVIYYDTNSWNFTRLGKINNASQTDLKTALGKGNVTVTISLK